MNANGEKGELVSKFKEALKTTEKSRDPQPLAGLFAQDAELTNLGGDHGHDAAQFWQIYLDQFEKIESTFHNEVVTEHSAALEWQSRGTTAEGHPVEYRGISVLDFGADRICGFRTYYDSAAFVRA